MAHPIGTAETDRVWAPSGYEHFAVWAVLPSEVLFSLRFDCVFTVVRGADLTARICGASGVFL